MTSQASSLSSSQGTLLRNLILATTLTASPATASLLSRDAVHDYGTDRLLPFTTWSPTYPASDNQKIYPLQGPEGVEFADLVAMNDNPTSSSADDDHFAAIGSQAFGEMHITPQVRERISYLRGLGDGWLGDGSIGAAHDAWIEAVSLLERIGDAAPDQPLPALGLASDGEIVFTWNKNGLIGSLSVSGDGTYSFFAKKDDTVAAADDMKIIDRLHEGLVEILTL